MIRLAISLAIAMVYCLPATGAEVDTCVARGMAKDACRTVHGELQFWQGWPPHLRIESSDKKHVFGFIYGEENPLPAPLQTLMDSGANNIKGEFVVCLGGGATSVPYDDRDIELACLKSMKISHSGRPNTAVQGKLRDKAAQRP